MNSKEYVMPDGKKVVFEYDHDGIGKVTIEAMDMLMGLIADGRKRGKWIEDTEEIKLKKRSMNEMISHFNRTVSEMDMPMSDKMTLLGIVTAIYQRYCEDTQQSDMETIKEGIEKQ